MADLIPVERAAQNPQLASLYATNQPYLASLISAASQLIQRYCGRDFVQTTYTEYYSGGVFIRESLKLRQFPVTGIQRIGVANQAVNIINAGVGIQRATVETLSTGDIQVKSVSSGVTTTNVITLAANVTVQAVASAIAALGNGWSYTIFSGAAGSYALFPSADLKPLQGAASAMIGGMYLDIYEDWYGWNTVAGWWDDGYDLGSAAPFWRLDDETGEVYGHLPRGQMNLRITYTAGFASIPDPIQEATVQAVIWLYQSGLINTAVKEARLGEAAYTLNLQSKLPLPVRQLINPYKDWSRTVYRG